MSEPQNGIAPAPQEPQPGSVDASPSKPSAPIEPIEASASTTSQSQPQDQLAAGSSGPVETTKAEADAVKEDDVRGQNGTESEPTSSVLVGHSGGSTADAPDAHASALPAGSAADAPGTANPFDPKEEADVGAISGSAAEVAPPAAAVAPEKESLISPVEVDGQAISAPVDIAAGPGSTQDAVDIPSSDQVTGTGPGISAPLQTEDTSPKDIATTDTEMADATTQELAAPPAAATATAAASIVEGDPLASNTNGAAPGDINGEPPAKRQRTEALSSALPEGAPNTASAPAADPSTIEMTAPQLKFAQNSVKSLRSRPESQAFLVPVDPDALNIPQYRQIITKPMDLGTIDIKLALTSAAAKGGKPTEKAKQAPAWKLDPARDIYHSVEEWEADVRLVFANCIQFNGPDHLISNSAKVLQAVFEKQLKGMPVELPPPPPPVVTEDEKRARRPSNPVPTIRRSSSDLSGRPKREIHPPAPRDLPYADEPQSASSTKKRKSSKALTPKQQAYYAKVSQEELKYCQKVIDEFFKPSFQTTVWPFYELVDKNADFGAAYYATIKKPICLLQIQDRLRKGVYRDKNDVNAEMTLLLDNAYTFNAPGSDVYLMAQNLQQAFRERMNKMPVPKPMSPEPDEDYDDDDDDEDDLAARIADLEEQLAQLRRQQQMAKSNKSAAAAKKKAAKAAAADASAKKKAAKNAVKSGGSTADGASKKSKKKKAMSDGSDDDEPFRPVTWEQKEELAAKIGLLSEERLDGALKIIGEDKPQNTTGDEEIELDIDDLSPGTLYKLYRWVVKPKRKPGPKPGTAKGASNKNSSGKKRKNLDEEQEAARIAALQEQLQSFNRGPDAAATPSAVPAHDDLVQSESSSGEEDSDGSESDY
ncbi:unnamed protein product [Sympodiomycopsis kandeliae]